MRTLRALSICVVAACTPTWRHAAVITGVVAIGELACDGGTTQQFLHAHAYYEGNPLLGPEPSDARLWTYLGVVAAALVVANYKMSPKWALAANVLVIGFETRSVAHNMSVGSSACGIGDGGPWLSAKTR